MCKLDKDIITSDMGSKKIANIINESLQNKNVVYTNGKILSISFKTICRYLNAELYIQWKLRKSFFVTKKQLEERVKFCKDILSKGLSFKDIISTDETKIELWNYTHGFIILPPQTWEKLKKGEEAYNLVNRPERNFEKSLMLAGGKFYHRLIKLIILDRTLSEFSYGQRLLFYKNDINSFNLKQNSEIYLEQDIFKPIDVNQTSFY